ncbi:hypothetical protein [Geodermatophilus sp. SYSU D01119]
MTAQHGAAPSRDDLPRWTPGPRDWVVDAVPAPPPPGHRRRRRGLLVTAAVLAVAAVIGGVVARRVLGSRPDSPSEVVQHYLAADQRHDWRASWALVCSADREAIGSLEQYVNGKDGMMAVLGRDIADVTVVVGGTRPRTDSTSRSYLVTVWIGHDGRMHREALGVVEEDGEYRVCG